MLGRFVADYRITGKLGVGGMGVVYEAEDTVLGRLVALKFLGDDIVGDEHALRRFTREAQMLALLNHPNICVIHKIADHDGRTFIVMELVDGVNLRTWTGTRTVDAQGIAAVGCQIARALEAAHAKGIVHRDIKPGNVVIGETGALKVLDFGLARSFQLVGPGLEPPPGSTLIGRPLGTVDFMAPERVLQQPLDGRSDLFSLGVILYEMATGSLPFASKTTEETMTKILEREPVRVRKRAPNAPAALEKIVERLLEKRADDRYQSASALLEALGQLEGRPRRPSFKDILRRLLSPGG